MRKFFILGVAGGSGSGKTYFVNDLLKKFGEQFCTVLYQDDFYFDQSKNFDFDGGKINFDHPSSLDFSSLAQVLKSLKEGKRTTLPKYDFATHSRLNAQQLAEPKTLILLDGILILHSPEVRELLDASVFFDTPEDLRFQRRLHRDIRERGRTPEGVFNQFYKQVQPMHETFVQPSKQFARWVFQDCEQYEEGLLEVEEYLRFILGLDSSLKAQLI
ncbi:MAG: uridine kinase [Bdellovibrionia bacterium]